MKLKCTMSLVLAAVIGLSANQAKAQMTFTSGTGLTQTQNFNGLPPASAGTIDAATIGHDWFRVGIPGGPQTQAVTSVVNSGANTSSLAGGVHNAGTSSSSTDRALGLSASGNASNGEPQMGVRLVNTTGGSLSGFTISGVTEKYRNGSDAAVERMVFEYSTNATSLITGTWTAVSALDLVEPNNTQTQTTTAVDGNLAANRAAFSGSITSLTLANNSGIWIRWRDNDGTGTDALLALDDLSITAVSANCTPTVAIQANPTATTICAGTSVTFSVNSGSSTNLGTPTAYQWNRNGNAIATATNATYTTTTLANNDAITLTVTSGAACASSSPNATSAARTYTVNPTVTPSVAISPATNSTVCTGTAVNFTATPTNGGTAPSYQWFVNNVASGTGSTFALNTAAPDVYIVGVTLTSNVACASTTTVQSSNTTITVTDPITPTVSISASPSQNICAGQQVTFNATTNAAAPAQTVAYDWRVNSTSVATTPTFSSTTLNNNDVVQLFLTVNGCVVNAPNTVASNSVQVGVTSQFTPTVTISGSNNGAAICQGTNVTFTASSFPSTGVSYQWQKNNVNVGTNSFQYSDATLQSGDQIHVIVTSSSTCATGPGTSNTIAPTVNPILVPSVTMAGPTSFICYGTPSTLTATGTNLGSAPTYTWYRNDTVEAVTTVPTYEVAKISVYYPETFRVEVSGINATCANPTTAVSNQETYQAVSTPQPSVTITDGSVKLCQGQGDEVTFTLKTQDAQGNPINTNPTDLQWQLNGANIPGATTGSYTANAAGNYQLILTAQGTSCVRSSTLYEVYESPLPTQNIDVQGATTFCAGSSVTLTADSAAGYKLRWMLDGINRGVRSSLVAKAAGTYTLSTTLNGCTVTSDPIDVNVIAAPITAVTPVGPLFLCDGASTTISAVADPAYTYTWYDYNTPIGQTGNSITVTAAGRYRASISNNGCPAKFTTAVHVTQTATPVATIALASSTATSRTLRANAGTGLTYQWYENGNTIVGATDRNYVTGTNGVYTVSVTRAQCTDISDPYTVAGLARMVSSTGVTETPVLVYPNPSADIFNIGYDEPVNVMVKDIQGRVIMDVRNASKVDMGTQAAGMYMMEIFNQAGNLIQVERLMKN